MKRRPILPIGTAIAVAALGMIAITPAASASSSSQPAVTPTAVVNVAAANAAGVPMPGFTVVDHKDFPATG